MKKKDQIEEVLLCECHSAEHTMLILGDNDPNCPYVYIYLHLCPDRFFRRIINAVKYIFGHRSKYGDFDEFILRWNDVEKLQGVVDKMKEYKAFYETEKD